jgi:hypothetical protein
VLLHGETIQNNGKAVTAGMIVDNILDILSIDSKQPVNLEKLMEIKERVHQLYYTSIGSITGGIVRMENPMKVNVQENGQYEFLITDFSGDPPSQGKYRTDYISLILRVQGKEILMTSISRGATHRYHEYESLILVFNPSTVVKRLFPESINKVNLKGDIWDDFDNNLWSVEEGRYIIATLIRKFEHLEPKISIPDARSYQLTKYANEFKEAEQYFTKTLKLLLQQAAINILQTKLDECDSSESIKEMVNSEMQNLCKTYVAILEGRLKADGKIKPEDQIITNLPNQLNTLFGQIKLQSKLSELKENLVLTAAFKLHRILTTVDDSCLFFIRDKFCLSFYEMVYGEHEESEKAFDQIMTYSGIILHADKLKKLMVDNQ